MRSNIDAGMLIFDALTAQNDTDMNFNLLVREKILCSLRIYSLLTRTRNNMNLKVNLLVATSATLLIIACNKNPVTPPPVHDTVTVIKTDTLVIQQKIDTPNLNNGLLVYLPFNGSMADSSGNGNTTTTVNGATLTYDAHGYANSAFGSSGSGEALLVTNNGSIKFDTAYSISFDGMIRSMGIQEIVIMTNYSNNQGATFGIGTNQPGIPNLIMGLTDSTVACGSVSNASNTTIDTCQFIPQPSSWYNVISTFQKGILKTYINGKLISTKTARSQLAHVCPSSQIVIGSGWGGAASLNGKVDEFRLYNRTLNAQEIAWLSRNFQPTSTALRPVSKAN
jgi:hypothetical protein